MPTGDEYRAKARQILAEAQAENNPHIIFEFQTLARSYLRLAELADRKKPDIVYETPESVIPPPEQIEASESETQPQPLAAKLSE